MLRSVCLLYHYYLFFMLYIHSRFILVYLESIRGTGVDRKDGWAAHFMYSKSIEQPEVGVKSVAREV